MHKIILTIHICHYLSLNCVVSFRRSQVKTRISNSSSNSSSSNNSSRNWIRPATPKSLCANQILQRQMQSCQKVPKYVKGSLPPLSRYGLKKVRCLDSLRTWQDGKKIAKKSHYTILEVFLLLLFARKSSSLVPFVWSWLEEKRKCVKCTHDEFSFLLLFIDLTLSSHLDKIETDQTQIWIQQRERDHISPSLSVCVNMSRATQSFS